MITPPAAKVIALAMFNAKIKGNVSEFPRRARFRFTGETSMEAIAGFPTVSDHQRTNIEMAIKTRVEIPATKAMILILSCITYCPVFIGMFPTSMVPLDSITMPLISILTFDS